MKQRAARTVEDTGVDPHRTNPQPDSSATSAAVAADQSELAGGNWRFSFAKRQLILFQASNAS